MFDRKFAADVKLFGGFSGKYISPISPWKMEVWLSFSYN